MYILLSVVAAVMICLMLVSIYQNVKVRNKPDWAETVLMFAGAIFFIWFLNFWSDNMADLRERKLDSEQRLEQVQEACDNANGTVLFTQNGTECWKNPVYVP